jgi:hypothetical protein
VSARNGSNAMAQLSLIAHELVHVIQQSPSCTSHASSSFRTILDRQTPSFGPANETTQPYRTGDVILQRQAARPRREAPRPTDDDLSKLLNRFASGEPVVLYHVDETGNVLSNIEQNGRDFSLRKGGEFHLTTNVEARTGFKSGAGLDAVIAFYLDRRFVSLLQELALPQRNLGKHENFFRRLLGIDLAIPRFNFEGGGRGQGRALRGTGDYNVALRSFDRTNEWNRLFKLSIQRVEHLRFNELLPAGSRLELVAQLYPSPSAPNLESHPSRPPPGGIPLLPVRPSGATPLTGPTESGSAQPQLPAPLLIVEPTAVPSSHAPVRGLLPGPVLGVTPLLTGPTAGSSGSRQVPAPLPVYEPIAVPGGRTPVRGLLPGPVLGETPLLTGPTAGSSGSRQVPAPLPVYEPTAVPSNRTPVRGLLPGPVLGQTPLLTDTERAQKDKPTALVSESGAARGLGVALIADYFARRWSNYVTEKVNQKARDEVIGFTPKLDDLLKSKPDKGAVVWVVFSKPPEDIFGVNPPYPPSFDGAGFTLIDGLTFEEAKANYLAQPVATEVPDQPRIKTYCYHWIPPQNSAESTQFWVEEKVVGPDTFLDQTWRAILEMKQRMTPAILRQE